MSAVVMCGGGHGAYDIVRALGRAGISPTVFVCHENDVALRSRYVAGKLLLPRFRDWNFSQILDKVSAYGARCADRPVLFYAGDSEIDFVARHRDILKRWYRVVLPDDSILQAVMSKALFVELAQKADLPVPMSRVFASAAELLVASGEVTFPCIVKPRFNQDWFWETGELRARLGDYKSALRRFDCVQDLRAFCAALSWRPGALVVQSYIDGGDDQLVSFHAYLDSHSRCLGSFLTREIRKNPPRTGDTTCSETFCNDELTQASIEYLARIGFCGVVKIDYKWDASARTYKMLEVEPHYQTAHLLGSIAGINLPLIAYRDARGEPVDACQKCKPQVRLIELRQDLRAYLRYRKAPECNGWRYARSLLAPNTHHRLCDRRDPVPFLYASLRYVLGKWRLPLKIMSRMLSRRRAGSSGEAVAMEIVDAAQTGTAD